MKTIVVTGINGFVGRHLTRALADNGCSVIGVSREAVADPEISGLLRGYVHQDIAERWPDITEPVDAVINLAGLAAVGPSFDQPQRYININSAIVTNIGEYYLKKDKKTRIVLISSGAVYSPDQTMPLSEDSRLGISSPYTISKVTNEMQAEYYRRRGLDVLIARPFNHIGPGQLGGFLVPDLIEKLAKLDKSKTIRVGNITTKRDYTDVRDVARAYHLLATTPHLNHMIYNICSGKSHSGQEILAALQDVMAQKDTRVEVDRTKIRPNDPADIFGSATKLYQDTGWEPVIDLEQTLKACVTI